MSGIVYVSIYIRIITDLATNCQLGELLRWRWRSNFLIDKRKCVQIELPKAWYTLPSDTQITIEKYLNLRRMLKVSQTQWQSLSCDVNAFYPRLLATIFKKRTKHKFLKNDCHRYQIFYLCCGQNTSENWKVAIRQSIRMRSKTSF